MKISKFEKAQKIYERVQKLDGEIIDIERLAHICAEGHNEINLQIKIKNLSKANDKKVLFDCDGSLIDPNRQETPGMFSFSFMLGSADPKKKEDKYTDRLEEIISDEVTLQVLGVLILQKQQERHALMLTLQKMGLEI